MIKNNRGFAYISYIIGAAVLSAIVAATIHLSSVKAGKIADTNLVVQTLSSQGTLIIGSIQSCLTNYPEPLETTADYGVTRQRFSNGTIVNAQFEWDIYPYLPQHSTSDQTKLRNIECPGLRERFCPGNAANTVCTDARIFNKNYETIDLDIPSALTALNLHATSNNAWSVILAYNTNLNTYRRAYTVTENGSGNLAQSDPTYFMVLALRNIGGDSANTATTVIKGVANSLESYQPCITRNGTTSLLVIPIVGDIDRNQCQS